MAADLEDFQNWEMTDQRKLLATISLKIAVNWKRNIFKKEEYMSKRTIGVVLVILGVVLLIVSLTADVIGIGNGTGIGWKQTLLIFE